MSSPAPIANETQQTGSAGNWVEVCNLADVEEQGRKLVKVGRKQIVLFHGPKGILACNNRCPHEGYPLMEGSLAEGCILTCNWHNWKFNLEDGETLVGGDRLRRYPVRIADGKVLLEVTDPPGEERAAEALANLHDAFPRYEYDRMAREIGRLQLAGADPLEALRQAVVWTHDRFEFGTSHAQASAADWLFLRDTYAEGDSQKLVPILESVGHLAWDTRREPLFSYPEASAPFDPDTLVAAIEQENEAAAVAQVRGALAEGLDWQALERPLAQAAMAHYQDFGHCAIYVYKTGQLIAWLGPDVTEPLTLALVRMLVYASREDLIPEFRAYAPNLAAWDGGDKSVTAQDFIGLDVKRALDLAVEASVDPAALYDALMGVGAWYMLHYDMRYQAQTDKPIPQNIGWLDFTHHITFGNAIRVLATRYPELWAPALLQLACFAGRNMPFVDRGLDVSEWRVDDAQAFLDKEIRGLFDHAQPEYIVSAHLVKLLVATREEVLAAPEALWVPDLLAAVNRFLHSPLKRKHVTRTARQALDFVALEG